jgi:hypothetical protein
MDDRYISEVPTFKYCALSGHHIRLAAIQAPIPGQPLNVFMYEVNTSLAIQIPNIAISYTAGNLTAKVPIICNGGILGTNLNLNSALFCLRRLLGDSPVRAWADALCIKSRR